MEEAHQQTDISEFCAAMSSGLARKIFGTDSELKQFFHFEWKEAPHPPGAPNQNQRPWRSGHLFIKMRAVYDIIKRDKRAQGQDMRLSLTDLRKQMASKKFWLVPKHRTHRKRFLGKNPEGCWGFDLDFLEGGYQSIADAEWLEYLAKKNSSGALESIDESEDPRHVELFDLGYVSFTTHFLLFQFSKVTKGS